MILDILRAMECEETPDRTRLNDLRLQAFEEGADARTLLLTLDAISQYKDAVAVCVDAMNAGTLIENPAWREEVLGWFATMIPETEAIGRLLDRIDPLIQTRAVARLKGELAPDDFARLYSNCGIGPV